KAAALFAALLFLCAGVYASFTLLNYAMAFLTVMAIILFIKKNTVIRIYAVVLIGAAGLGLYILTADTLKILKQSGQLYYGGDTFVTGSVSSFIRYSFYMHEGSGLLYPASILAV